MQDIGHEPSVESPDESYVMADCGCEIYDGEKMYEYISGKRIITMCAAHYLDQILADVKDITIDEVADIFQHNYSVVSF